MRFEANKPVSKRSTDNLPTDQLPRHVAIVMDGNGRWAKNRKQQRYSGHKAGVEVVRSLVEDCVQRGIPALTLFAFSSENWARPKKEVSLLMELFMASLKKHVEELNKSGVRIRFIGDRSAFGKRLQKQIGTAEEKTAENDGLQLNIAANYGGRWDVTEAVRKIAHRVETGTLSSADITPELINQNLSLCELPDPDLFIRTGGEERISNFLLWQLAYSELYFTDTLWPDFDLGAFEQALAAYSQRQRRFGKTGDQVEETSA